jgi:hypothetical protein
MSTELPHTPGPVILDGLYRLDEDHINDSHSDWKFKSIYWQDDEDPTLFVRRGTWFSTENGQPLCRILANSIEDQHLKVFKDQLIPLSPVYSEAEAAKKPGMYVEIN